MCSGANVIGTAFHSTGVFLRNGLTVSLNHCATSISDECTSMASKSGVGALAKIRAQTSPGPTNHWPFHRPRQTRFRYDHRQRWNRRQATHRPPENGSPRDKPAQAVNIKGHKRVSILNFDNARISKANATFSPLLKVRHALRLLANRCATDPPRRDKRRLGTDSNLLSQLDSVKRANPIIAAT